MGMITPGLTPLFRVEDVIEALGGNSQVAAATSTLSHRVRGKTVWSWQAAGVFPAKTYVVMTLALTRAGFCAPVSLWGMIDPTETLPLQPRLPHGT